MNFFQRLFNRKAASQRVLFTSTGTAVGMGRDFAKLSEEGFKKNVIAYRAIGSISSHVATLDWLLFKKGRSARAKRTEIETHPLLDLLNNPNPHMGRSQFFEAVVAYRLIAGDSFIQAVGPTDKKITEVWPQRPDHMRVVPGIFGIPKQYEYQSNADKKIFPVDQVTGNSAILQWKTFNPVDHWRGLSPIEAVVYGIDLHNEASKWNFSLLKNSAVPSGALMVTETSTTPGAKLSDSQFDKLKNQIDERYSGGANAGRPMLLEGGMDWKQFSLSPRDMDWINSKHVSAREVATAFGYPPLLLNIPGDSTFSNYKEARQALYEDTVIPLASSLRDALNQWLVPSFGNDLFIDFDVENISALEPKRQIRWDRANLSTDLTINERRALKGYDEVEGGDAIMVSPGLIPLDLLIEEANNPPDRTEDPDDSEEDSEDEEDNPEPDEDEE